MTIAALLATGAPLVGAQTNSQDDYEKASTVASSYHSVKNDDIVASVADAQKIKDGGDQSVKINKLDPLVKHVYSGAEYEKAKKEIADELAKVAEKNKAAIKEYQDAVNHNAAEKKRILEEEEEIKAKFPLLAEKDGVRVYGKFNEEARGSQDYYKDIHVFVDDETSTMFKDGVYVHEDSQFIPLVGDKQTIVTSGDGKWKATYDNMSSDDANPKGTKVKITHVADTTDGNAHMYADIFGKNAKVNLHVPDNAKVPTLEVTEQEGEITVETIGVTPEKHAYNSIDILIDGKSVLKGSEIRYGVTADYDAYKGLPKPEKPFTPAIIDDIPEDMVELTIYNKVVAGGKDITDEMERHIYESIDEAPDYIKDVAKDKVSGKFVAWTPKDKDAYTTNYILTGTDVTAYIGALPKENIVNTAIVNKGMQIDFQGLHDAKPVENKVIVPKPEKSVKKAGEDINEKTLLQGTVFNYEFKWSLAEYKDISLPDAKSINLFAFIDDIQDDALDLTETPITIKDGDTDISDKFEIIKTKDGQFGQFTEILGDNKVEGEGFAIVAKDTNAFLQDYVLKGKDLTITVEAKVDSNFDGTIENEGKQIDFNNKGVTVTNKVRNKTPEFKPVKDVKVGDKSVDGSSIELDSEFNYVLTADIMQAETIGDLKDVSLVDNYNEEFDQLTNINKVTAKTDIKLKDGSVIKAGEDITKYATFKDDKGVLTVELSKEFVEKVSDRQDVSIGVTIGMKRIKASEKVENTYDLIVNGHKVASNTVVTKTPNKALPSTGTEIGLTLITVVAVVTGGYIYIGKRKQVHSK